MKRLLIIFALVLSTLVFADEQIIYTALSQDGIKFYSQSVTADVKATQQTISWEKFIEKVTKAWYQDEEGNWKEMNLVVSDDTKSSDEISNVINLDDLDDFFWTSSLELSTHVETKTLSRPEHR